MSTAQAVRSAVREQDRGSWAAPPLTETWDG